MIEDIIKVDESILLWDEVDKLSYGSIIRKKLFSLPPDSTLYVDLKNVEHMDHRYAFDAVAMLQCSSGRGPLRGKHLILIEPTPAVLQSIENAVDEADTAFLYLDSKGTLSAGGKTFSPSLRMSLVEILKSKNPIPAKSLNEILEIGNVQACGNYLKKLYDWGFICRVESEQNTRRKTKRAGRPTFSYYPYWPKKAQAWEIPRLEKGQKSFFFYNHQYKKVVGAK